MKKLRIYHCGRIAGWVADAHWAFGAWLTKNYPLRHNLDLFLKATSSLTTCKGPAWGYFYPAFPPAIVLACRRPKYTLNKRCGDLLDTFAHEWCHYEQWRDGHKFHHRGLQRRVDSLIRLFRKELNI